MAATSFLPAPPLPAADAHWALFLDVDGSLLDFAQHPEQVQVTDALKQLLHQLHHQLDGALALVSGRHIHDLDHLFEAQHWAKAGLHGLELQWADGRHRRFTIEAHQQAQLHREAKALLKRLPGIQLEDKDIAVAFHSRGTPQQWSALYEGATALLHRLPGFELQPGNQVVEIKPRGMDKGMAVAELLTSTPFAGRTAVYLGDDLTDEHAFATVNLKQGISIRVGAREPSVAQFSLPAPAAVHVWLTQVRDMLKAGTSKSVAVTART